MQKEIIYMLPFMGEVCTEIRKAYFLKGFDRPVEDMRIFSFGKCNYACFYCKRHGYDKNNGVIDGAVQVSKEHIIQKIDDTIEMGQIIRLSGGDPLCYPQLAEHLLSYAKAKGAVTSIATNGSDTAFIKRILPVTDYFAIDYKTETAGVLSRIAGISTAESEKMLENTKNSIRLSAEHTLTDVRTCILPDLSEDMLLAMAESLSLCNTKNIFWTLRAFDRGGDKKADLEFIKNTAARISERYPKLRIGIRCKWASADFIYL